MLSKTGKFRRGSQGNHPAALSINEDRCDFYFAALIFWFVLHQSKMNIKSASCKLTNKHRYKFLTYHSSIYVPNKLHPSPNLNNGKIYLR